jgi:hypothetical protein
MFCSYGDRFKILLILFSFEEGIVWTLEENYVRIPVIPHTSLREGINAAILRRILWPGWR